MTHLASAVSNTHTYLGNSEINFFSDDENGLSVTIDTDRLHMRSVEATESEYDHYAALFGDKDVMEKYAIGQTKTRNEIKTRINDIWVKRWREKDPYTGLAVFKKDTDDFVGHVALGHGDHPGQAELAGLGNRSFWEHGYGSEAASAIVKEYAPAIIQEGYFLKGKPLQTIVGTARPDNPASSRILEKIGFHFVCEEERHGALRRRYEIDL
ncbi:MAG: GNAT family N-acetyltransferase [Chlamydiales bacterium]|nr:GNAT family N-acetyltransferase [Chlamydiales bacterium]